MAKFKVDDLVEVFFDRRGSEANSNRLQIVDVIERPGQEVIYTGVRVMDYERWKVLKAEDSELCESIEKDFLESQVQAHSRVGVTVAPTKEVEAPKVVYVGYWRSSDPRTAELPVPKARLKPWKGRAIFLQELEELESKLHAQLYKGFSTCRICGCTNGNGEYEHKGFRWPDGFLHYVKWHNVKPPQEFIDMVMLPARERHKRHAEQKAQIRKSTLVCRIRPKSKVAKSRSKKVKKSRAS